MSERLVEKLDRLGAEAGIETMTPEIRRFALLVRDDVVAGWPAKPWARLTDARDFGDSISVKANADNAAAELRRLHVIEEAAKNLVKVKGRYHTEQAFNKLKELLK